MGSNPRKVYCGGGEIKLKLNSRLSSNDIILVRREKRPLNYGENNNKKQKQKRDNDHDHAPE